MKSEFNLKYNYLVIEGNIGSGKTSLALMLAKETNSRLILEEFADNPFLPDFYKNPSRYAFPLELSFLAERYHQLKEKFARPELFNQTTVSDYLFVKSLLFAQINLSEDEYQLYRKLFNIIDPMLPRPDLLIYLHNTTEQLLINIEKRGRGYEKAITAEYLDKVHNSYMNYFRQMSRQRILILSTGKADFVNNKNDYRRLKEIIQADYSPGLHTIIL